MYVNDEYSAKIVIDLYPGVHVFEKESATGKTYLCNVLKKMQAYGEPVYAFTYNDYLSGRRFENELEVGKYEVIMLDRFDMYTVYDSDILDKCADDAIVLIDYKGRFPVSFGITTCAIRISPGKIEVDDDLYKEKI